MLTPTKLDKLKANGKVQRYSDRDGLTFEFRPSGTKRFIVRFQWDKKPQTIAIGRYPSLSLADARKIAASYRALVDQGIDPRIGLRTNSEHKLTLKTIAEQWFQKNSHLWRESTKRMHLRSLNRDVYPFISNARIDEIRKADLLSVIHPHEERGHHEIAHRLHDRLKAIFDFAVACDLTENYPFIGLKKALAPKPKIKNQVAINPHEAHEMLDTIRKSKAGTVTKLFIELLAHLFVRPSELRLAKWSEFNLQQCEWHILAPVEIVGEFQLYHRNVKATEKLLHKFFHAAQADVEIKDRFGNPVRPREWFFVTVKAIQDAVRALQQNKILDVRYDHKSGKVVDK